MPLALPIYAAWRYGWYASIVIFLSTFVCNDLEVLGTREVSFFVITFATIGNSKRQPKWCVSTCCVVDSFTSQMSRAVPKRWDDEWLPKLSESSTTSPIFPYLPHRKKSAKNVWPNRRCFRKSRSQKYLTGAFAFCIHSIISILSPEHITARQL